MSVDLFAMLFRRVRMSEIKSIFHFDKFLEVTRDFNNRLLIPKKLIKIKNRIRNILIESRKHVSIKISTIPSGV